MEDTIVTYENNLKGSSTSKIININTTVNKLLKNSEIIADFKECIKDELLQLNVKIFNDYDRDLTVKESAKSCGCLSVFHEPDLFKPNDTFEMTVKVYAKPGSFIEDHVLSFKEIDDFYIKSIISGHSKYGVVFHKKQIDVIAEYGCRVYSSSIRRMYNRFSAGPPCGS